MICSSPSTLDARRRRFRLPYCNQGCRSACKSYTFTLYLVFELFELDKCAHFFAIAAIPRPKDSGLTGIFRLHGSNFYYANQDFNPTKRCSVPIKRKQHVSTHGQQLRN